MGILIDKSLILNRIKSYYNFDSDAKLARFLGIKPNSLANWYSRNSIDYDLVFSKCEELSTDWLLTGQGEMLKNGAMSNNVVNEPSLEYNAIIPNKSGIPLIPINALAGIGIGDIQVAEKDIVDYYEVPLFESRGAKYLIPVAGNSMYPKYASGDLLACKPLNDFNFAQWGKPYVLDTEQGAIVKRLFPHPTDDDVFICKSDNQDNYPPFNLPKSSIYKIAIVVGVIRLE